MRRIIADSYCRFGVSRRVAPPRTGHHIRHGINVLLNTAARGKRESERHYRTERGPSYSSKSGSNGRLRFPGALWSASYSGLHVDAKARTATFTVENTGSVAATEIAEVYVGLPPASGEHFRRLAAWQRVAVDAGQHKVVTVALEPLALASFDEKKDAWSWLRGKYTVSVGGSSRDLPLRAEVSLY
jgi:hypothetical protein